jgi:ADP-ribosylglycohydrolase
MPDSADTRMARALVSLDGLSVGDAFGERFFLYPHVAQLIIGERGLPDPPWRYTDDTQMALSIVETLRTHGEIEQTFLAKSFGKRYDISRGYGPAMHQLLPMIRSGKRWEPEARSLFGGQGSWGNGSAMRVAPLGAYFADDLDAAIEQAAKSAVVTHAHSEAVAGATAIAVAAALACQAREQSVPVASIEFIEQVLAHVPESNTRAGIVHVRDLPADVTVLDVAEAVGNGRRVSCLDTVPFCLWCAAHYLDDYEEAMWVTVSALGDRDTTCAIVGGIVACYTGVEGIPPDWLAAREPLPDWIMERA